jgi:hypothetical protein
MPDYNINNELQKHLDAVGYGQRGNKFRITFPDFLEDTRETDTSETVSYLVESTSVPAKGIGTVKLNWMGVQASLPGDLQTSGTWNCTIKLDSENKAQRAFNTWLSSIFDSLSGTRGDLKEVFKKIKIELLDKNNAPASTYYLLNAFLTNLGDISVAMTSENQITTWALTFAYADIAFDL